MKKLNLSLLLGLVIIVGCKDQTGNPSCSSCSKIDKLSKEKGQEYLGRLYEEIQTLSKSVACTDGSKWDTLPIGSKGCGGPIAFVAYMPERHGEDFKKKVVNFTEAQQAYNKKWSVISDCMALLKPSRVDCVDGKPKLIP